MSEFETSEDEYQSPGDLLEKSLRQCYELVFGHAPEDKSQQFSFLYMVASSLDNLPLPASDEESYPDTLEMELIHLSELPPAERDSRFESRLTATKKMKNLMEYPKTASESEYEEISQLLNKAEIVETREGIEQCHLALMVHCNVYEDFQMGRLYLRIPKVKTLLEIISKSLATRNNTLYALALCDLKDLAEEYAEYGLFEPGEIEDIVLGMVKKPVSKVCSSLPFQK